MDNSLPLALRMFNDRVRAMNQSNSKLLTLNADEARNLHAEIYSLLTITAEQAKHTPVNENIFQINMDGGGFK